MPALLKLVKPAGVKRFALQGMSREREDRGLLGLWYVIFSVKHTASYISHLILDLCLICNECNIYLCFYPHVFIISPPWIKAYKSYFEMKLWGNTVFMAGGFDPTNKLFEGKMNWLGVKGYEHCDLMSIPVPVSSSHGPSEGRKSFHLAQTL